MELTITPRGTLQINDARICFKNFKGERSMYNPNGARTFSLIIPDDETAEILMNDKSEHGIGWNIKIKAPQTPDEEPFRHMKVKLSFSDRSQPNIWLISGRNRTRLTEKTVGMLDDISIEKVDLDIRPWDNEGTFGAHRTAYLIGMQVTQKENYDRFAERWAGEESPMEDDEEIPFD